MNTVIQHNILNFICCLVCIYIGHLNITDIDFFLREQYNILYPLGSYIFVSEYYIFSQRFALRKKYNNPRQKYNSREDLKCIYCPSGQSISV